jgi:hypothetical protein
MGKCISGDGRVGFRMCALGYGTVKEARNDWKKEMYFKVSPDQKDLVDQTMKNCLSLDPDPRIRFEPCGKPSYAQFQKVYGKW